jgi:hypothetical protein
MCLVVHGRNHSVKSNLRAADLQADQGANGYLKAAMPEQNVPNAHFDDNQY